MESQLGEGLVSGGLMSALPVGLVLRSARPSDRAGLVDLQGIAHAGPDGRPNTAVAAWTRDLFDRDHPTLSLDDVLVVEDPSTGQLVSSVAMVRQVWDYAGVPLGVGRLELVATRPNYRGRGLTSHQMRVLHERSTSAGDVLQVITDLMYYHGELGYHSALVQRAGRGGRVEALWSGRGAESTMLRPATVDDVFFLASVDRHARQRSLLSCPRDPTLWEYELVGRDHLSMMRDEISIIEWAGAPAGYIQVGYGGIPSFSVPAWLPGLAAPEPVAPVCGLELLPDVPWLEVVPSVLRRIVQARGEVGYLLWLGTEHPAYDVLADCLCWRPPNIGWFIRVGDLTRLLTTVAPVLEQRLATSIACGYTGVLRLHFYTRGVELRFVAGKLIEIQPWTDHSRRASDASMPEQLFCQLVLGHGEISELAPAYPDFRLQNRIGAVLLSALFQQHHSHIWPLI